MPWPELPTVRPAALLPFPLVYLTGLENSFWMFLVCWVSIVSQGFPRFPKSQNSVLSQNHLFKYYQDDRSHCDRRNLVGELQELTRQASEQNFQARPQLQTTEELSARVIHNTSVEAWLFAVPGSPNNKTLISPDHRGTGSTDQTLTSPASQAISTGKVFAGSSKKLACGLHSQDSKQWLECH